MARKKNPVNPALEPGLPDTGNTKDPFPPAPGPLPFPAAALTIPSLVEYKIGGVAWRCGRFDALAAELGPPTVTAETIGVLHETISLLERPWRILRRLFGMMPMLPPVDYAEDDMRSWMRMSCARTWG